MMIAPRKHMHPEYFWSHWAWELNTDIGNATLLDHGTIKSLSVFQYPFDYYLCFTTEDWRNSFIYHKTMLVMAATLLKNYSEEYFGSFIAEYWNLQDKT